MNNFEEKMEALMNGLPEAQKEKAKTCTSPEELMDLFVKEGQELTSEMMEMVSGGSMSYDSHGWGYMI